MKTNPNSITAPRRALISVVNGTNITVQVNNNIMSNLGPYKGKWMLHKELLLAPKACATTEFLVDATHQLMVYEATKQGKFLYSIDGTDIENNHTVEIFEDSYNVVKNLLCL